MNIDRHVQQLRKGLHLLVRQLLVKHNCVMLHRFPRDVLFFFFNNAKFLHGDFLSLGDGVAPCSVALELKAWTAPGYEALGDHVASTRL